MKILSDMLAHFVKLEPALPDAWVNATWNSENFCRHKPTQVNELRCQTCNGKDGYIVLDGREKEFKGWSCKHPACNKSISRWQTLEPRLPPFSSETSGVPPNLEYCRQSEWFLDPERQLECLCWLESKRTAALLSGNSGVGKTYTACLLLREYWLAHRKGGRFISVPRLSRDYMAEVKGNTISKLDAKLIAPDLLILDDLGQKSPPDGLHDLLLAVIDERMGSSKKTLVTTNLNSDSLTRSIGSALFSRLTSGLIIKFGGEDRRATF